jgi:hypothetical protein
MSEGASQFSGRRGKAGDEEEEEEEDRVLQPLAIALSDISSLAERPLYLLEDESHRPMSTANVHGVGPRADPGDEYGAEDETYELSRREVVERLRMVHGVSEVVVDQSAALALKRPGFDLAVFESQSFRCNAADEGVSHVPLVLKRITCVDRRMYDIKVYELDTFMRFMKCAMHSGGAPRRSLRSADGRGPQQPPP